MAKSLIKQAKGELEDLEDSEWESRTISTNEINAMGVIAIAEQLQRIADALWTKLGRENKNRKK